MRVLRQHAGDPITSMWTAFVFGAVVAGSIGPIALLIFGTAARQGFAAGIFAGLGAALADLFYALAALSIGAALLPRLTAYAQPIEIGCALLLVGLGLVMLMRLARKDDSAIEPRPAASSLLPTFMLTIANPMTLVVLAGIVPQLPVAGSYANAAAHALALAAGSAVVQIAIAAAGAALGQALPGAGWRRAVSAVAALGILVFGVYSLLATF